MALTNTDTRRKLLFIQALLETIVDAGNQGAPSGICYAALSHHGVDIGDYQDMVAGLVAAGLVTNKSHVLHATPKVTALMAEAVHS